MGDCLHRTFRYIKVRYNLSSNVPVASDGLASLARNPKHMLYAPRLAFGFKAGDHRVKKRTRHFLGAEWNLVVKSQLEQSDFVENNTCRKRHLSTSPRAPAPKEETAPIPPYDVLRV